MPGRTRDGKLIFKLTVLGNDPNYNADFLDKIPLHNEKPIRTEEMPGYGPESDVIFIEEEFIGSSDIHVRILADTGSAGTPGNPVLIAGSDGVFIVIYIEKPEDSDRNVPRILSDIFRKFGSDNTLLHFLKTRPFVIAVGGMISPSVYPKLKESIYRFAESIGLGKDFPVFTIDRNTRRPERRIYSFLMRDVITAYYTERRKIGSRYKTEEIAPDTTGFSEDTATSGEIVIQPRLSADTESEISAGISRRKEKRAAIRFRVFVSYSVSDENRLDIPGICRALENMESRSGSGRIFTVEKVIYWGAVGRAGGDIVEFMERGIKRCHIFIPVITESYISSYNCKKERNYAILLNKQIIPLYESSALLDGIIGLYRGVDINGRDTVRIASEVEEIIGSVADIIGVGGGFADKIDPGTSSAIAGVRNVKFDLLSLIERIEKLENTVKYLSDRVDELYKILADR